MTASSGGGPPAGASAAARTELELFADMKVLGVGVEATATLATGEDTVFAVRFRDLTLGQVLDYLVNLAEPGLNFSLPPPWDALNSIRLDDFAFEIDTTHFRIGFRYDGLGFTFPLASLDRIEVWYSPPTRDRAKSLDISLFGSFLGIDFTSPPGLTWDALSQPAPAVPGKGPKYFDLEYLGIGQHVALRDPASATTLAGVLAALEGSYGPVDRRKNPLAGLPALRFDPTGGWLVGTKFSALDTVTLAVVFDDPSLFGLRITLDGPRAKILAGLAFEILYRRINDHLGVYHVELKLPDVLRKIEAGEATITLPVIDLDVYTNGDFLLDLGFPHNLDFSRSFSVDLIVWVGPIPVPVSAAGGLYFGVLSGESSTQVPAITNGRFAPVIVAGFGVRVGLGKSLAIGPLDAGFFAGIVGILEGVLAWFHPDDPAIAPATYFKVRGTVGIQIHIWGRIDFSILQASVDILAYATASVAIESHQPIEVGFSAGVSLELSVKVLFFHITLKFSATITESFTIGQATPTPWQVDTSAPAPAAVPAAPQAERGLVLASGRPVAAQAAFVRLLEAGVEWHDQPQLVAAVTAPSRTLPLYVHPMVTAARPDDRPGGSGTAAPQPHLVAMLFVADRGQLEGALAVANRDAKLTPGRQVELLDKSIRTTGDADTFASLAAGAGGPAPDSAVFTLGWLNRARPGLLAASDAEPLTVQPPAGFVPAGDPVVLRDDTQSLTDLARGFLSPFEQLARDLLLWAIESADAGLATGAPEPLRADSSVTASHLRAVLLDLADPARPLTPAMIAGFFTARRITLELTEMPSSAANPSFTVFPMPPFLTMTVPGEPPLDFGSQPYQVTPAYVQAIAAYVRDLADPGPAPAVAGPATGGAPSAVGAAAAADEPTSVAALLYADWFTFLLRQVVQDALDVFRSVRHQPTPGAGESLPAIAARFGLADPNLTALTHANKANPAFYRAASVPGSGAALTIAERVVPVLENETLRSLAARLQLTPLVVALAARDDPALLAAGSTVTVSGGTCVVAPGETLAALASRLGAPLEVVVTAAAAVPRLVKALVSLSLGGSTVTTTPVDTLASLAAALGVQLPELGQAVADRDDLLYAGVTFPLPDVVHQIGAGGPESLADVAARYRVPIATVVAGANADALGLRAGARVVSGLSVVTRVGESLAGLAARLDPAGASLTALGVATALRDQTGLLAPGAALLVNPHAVTPPPAGYVIRNGDSLASIAAAFGTTSDALVAANAGVSWYPTPDGPLRPGTGITVPVGERITLPPDLTYRIRPGDTLAGVAERFGMSLPDLLGPETGNDTSATLLAGQVTVVLPPFTHEVADSETPLEIAARYGLTVDALVAANPEGPFGTVLVPDAELLPLADLLQPLTVAGAFDRPAGALARFLLHGLRLPAPDALPHDPAAADWSTVALHPMPTVTGQQVTPPSPLPADFAVTLALNGSTPRPDVTIAGGGDSLGVRPDEAAVARLAEQLSKDPPFDADPLSATPYPAAVAVPQLFALADPVPWLAPGPVELRQPVPPGLGAPAAPGGDAAAATGTPSLRAFPQPLRTRIAAGVAGEAAPALHLTLQAGSKTGPASATDTVPVSGYGWVTRLDVSLRTVPDPANPARPTPYVYELSGAGPGTVDDLSRLLGHLRDGGAADTVEVRLLYATDPATGSPGLRSDPIRPEELLLVRANLSNSAQPPAGATPAAALRASGHDGPDAAPVPAQVAAATTAPEQARDFLTLVWEAAVTNSGGYLLLYRVAATAGGDLPAHLFDQSRSGTVSLLVTVLPASPAPAAGSTPPGTVGVRPFHNAVLVTQNLPDATAPVYVAPPRYPLPAAPGTLRGVADALGLQVGTVAAANAVVPGLLATGRPVTVAARTHQVLPGETLLDVAAALGAPLDDVVAAIADAPGAVRPGTPLFAYPDWTAKRSALRPGAAGFRILRGNPDPGAVDPDVAAPARVGQDDPATSLAVLFNLVGYSLAGGQDFRATGDGLPVGPAQQGDGTLDGGATDGGGVRVWTYAKQVRIDRFATGGPEAPPVPGPDPYGGVGGTADVVWHHQDLFGNRILPARTLPVPVLYTDPILALASWPSIVAAYHFSGDPGSGVLSVAVGLDAGTYVAPAGDPVAPIGADGGPGPASGLAARATADRDAYAQVYWQLARGVTATVTTSLDGGVAHPVDAATLAGFAAAAWRYLGSVAALRPLAVTTDGSSTLRSIAATYQVSPGELAQANRSNLQNAAADQVLQMGTHLSLEQRSTVIGNETLRAIAARAAGTVPAPEALAAANAGVPLRRGVLLVLGRPGSAVAAGTIAAAAAAAGLSVVQWASANELRVGLLAAGATVSVPAGYRVTATDTLASLAVRANRSAGDLATALADTAGLLAPDGVPVLPATWAPAPQDTLGSLAARFGLTAAQLAAPNADAAGILRPGAVLGLPAGGSTVVAAGETLAAVATRSGQTLADLAALNADRPGLLGPGPVTARYAIKNGDTLAAVAAAFPAAALTAADLGAANADLPGLFAAGGDVLLGTRDYIVKTGDTFASIAQTEGVDVAGIGAANADRPILAAGRRLAVPRHAVLGNDVTATVLVPAGAGLGGLAGDHGVDPGVLAAANADLVGVLQPGNVVRYLASDGRTWTDTTRDGDTVSTLTARLQASLLAAAVSDHVTAARLGDANPDLPLVAGARLLLPPTDLAIDVPVAASDDAALLDVGAALTLSRDGGVEPTLADAPGVAAVTSPLAPDLGTGANDDPLALVRFARGFEHVFSDVPLKLATAAPAADAPAGRPRLLAVRYPSPVLDVEISAAGASFLAPPPLSTELWSSPVPVPIRSYTPGQALGDPRPTSFTGIDLDLWARSFLGVLDRALSPDYAVPAYTRDPAAYSALLAAKGDLAAALSASVVPIVDPPAGANASTGPDLDAARETLRQRLLVSLSEAYQLDAIVQLPVAVTAPAAWSGPNAPRLHGQASAATYRVPEGTATTATGDTLAALAARTGTTLAALGEDNATAVGLLEAGVSLRPGDPAAAAWTTLAGDSFDALAARVDRPLADVVAAAADVPGLLRAGVDVAVPRATLRSVAADLGVPLQLLVDVVADQPYLVRLGAQLPGTPPRIVAPGPGGQAPTLGTVAQLLGTPVATVGTQLGDVPGLLARDAAVNVVRRTYALAADDTLFTALDVLALDLSAPQLLASAVDGLAALNAALPDVFAPGAVLDVPAPVLVGEPDTLAGIAAAHGLTPAELGRSVAGRTDVLRPGVALVLPDGTSLTTGAGSSLEGLAARAAAPLDDVVNAAAGVSGLLVPGTVWALPGPANTSRHVVTAGETWESIGAGLPVAQAALVTPAWLVTTQLHVPGIVRAGAVLAYLSRVPGFTLSGGEIVLSGSGPAALTLLFRTASSIRFSSLTLDLGFQLTQLEYDVAAVPWAPGHRSSSWASFLVAPTDQGIGAVDVPIPVRAYPIPPSVTSQATVPAASAAHAALPDAAAVEEQRVAVRLGDTTHTLAERVGVAPATVAAAAVRHAVLPRSVLGGTGEPGPGTGEPGQPVPLPADTVLPVPLVPAAGPTPAGPVGAGADPPPAPPTLPELRRYDYSYTFTCRRDAQDTITLGQELNAPPLEASVPRAGRTGDLPVALAQFAAVQQALETDLALLAGAAPAGTPAAAEDRDPGVAALRVLAGIATAVAAGWAQWTAPAPGPVAAPDATAVPASFRLRRAALPTGQTSVHVAPLAAAARSAVPPEVHLRGHDREDVPLTAGTAATRAVFTRSLAPLVDAGGGGTIGLGTATETLPGQDEFTVTVRDLDLATAQNVWGDVRLTRNATLLPGIATNPAFVYAVPPARMPTPAIPLVSAAAPFDVTAVPFLPAGAPGADGAVAGAGQTLVTWLRNLLDSMLNRYAVLAGDTLAGLAVRYGSDVPAVAAAVADVAGLLVPGTTLSLPGGDVTVAGADTLASLAAGRSLSVADLAVSAAEVAGLLAPGTLVRPAALTRTVRIAVDYAFVLATNPGAIGDQRGELVSRLPVVLQPALPFDSDADLAASSGFCADLAAQLTSWADDRGLDPQRGSWIFDVSLYTTLPGPDAGAGNGGGQTPPLLELRSAQLDRRLVLPGSGGTAS